MLSQVSFCFTRPHLLSCFISFSRFDRVPTRARNEGRTPSAHRQRRGQIRVSTARWAEERNRSKGAGAKERARQAPRANARGALRTALPNSTHQATSPPLAASRSREGQFGATLLTISSRPRPPIVFPTRLRASDRGRGRPATLCTWCGAKRGRTQQGARKEKGARRVGVLAGFGTPSARTRNCRG